jgi:hypothetical protein
MQSAQDSPNASTSYLLQFYFDLENMTTQLSNYNNLLVYMENKYKNVEENSIAKEDWQQLDAFSQQCRFWVTRLYVKYCALSEKFSELNAKKETINDLYAQIAKEKILKFDSLKEFAVQLNIIFVSGLSDKFFVDTQNAFSKISGGQ